MNVCGNEEVGKHEYRISFCWQDVIIEAGGVANVLLLWEKIISVLSCMIPILQKQSQHRLFVARLVGS